ncbi:MAG: hypothetical protein ACT4OM_12905 [Actinomycetota bacterium]
MDERIIDRIHRILGLGMAEDSIEELAADHVETARKRRGLNWRGHLGFIFNNPARRLTTSPRTDMGAHFLPSLFVSVAGVLIYLIGGKGPTPDQGPSWPMLPLAAGVVWLSLVSYRVRGFPTKGAIWPMLLTSFGAIADAVVLPVTVPEDNLIRVGLAVLGVAGPAVFVMFSRKNPDGLEWKEVVEFLAGNPRAMALWHLLSVGLGLIATGELLALVRPELPTTLRIGAVVSGVGLFWMAESFHRATRRPTKLSPSTSD